MKAVMDSRHHMISYFMGISKSILRNLWYLRKLALRKKCPYSEFFWSVLSGIRTKYGDLQRLNIPILWEIWANMWELMDKKNPRIRASPFYSKYFLYPTEIYLLWRWKVLEKYTSGEWFYRLAQIVWQNAGIQYCWSKKKCALVGSVRYLAW